MIQITEKKKARGIFYEYRIIEKGKVLYSRDILYRAIIKNVESKDYLILYDPQMIPDSKVFGFLNFAKAGQSINTRIKSLEALKFLLCFQTIISKTLKDFSLEDIQNLKYFLKGYSPAGNSIGLKLLTNRNDGTVNGYLSIYREFLSYLGHENRYLGETIKSSRVWTEKFKISEPGLKKTMEVPWFISVDNYATIIEVIRNRYGKLEECIVRLMFECGLRIGEVLGLTAEDLVVEKMEGQYVTLAYIRNRLSDSNDWQAKTCMKILSSKQYGTKSYKTKNYGYQTVVVPRELFALVNDYIEETHPDARIRKHGNYYKYTKADHVCKEHAHDVNYYIFINSLGKPLSSHLWNRQLREIFSLAGIPVDSHVREHNLNHRFRHGFAMFHIIHRKCKALELMELMRHTSLESVTHYYKPTVSHAVWVKTEFTKELRTIIPSLEL
jgi:integrase/recombinase XerD